MKERKIRTLLLLLSLIYIGFLGWFYYVYVPLIKPFQILIAPILLLTSLLAFYRLEYGLLWFVFALPLINSLPYFFKIYWHIPHAPTALLLFLFFYLGRLLNSSFRPQVAYRRSPLYKTVSLAIIIISISGAITFWRYANFAPILTNRAYELVVNQAGVRAGGARMSVLFNLLNYLTGFLFLFIVSSVLQSRKMIKKVLAVLSVSTFLSLFVALLQKYHSPTFGNQPFWISNHQINATFKDPNSFGAYLAAAVPVFIGLLVSAKLRFRPFLLALITLALFVFPSIGARSALFAMTFSLLILIGLLWKSSSWSLRKKVLGSLGVAFLILIIFFFSLVISKERSLYDRLAWSLETLEGKGTLLDLSTGKLDLWRAAVRMDRDFPLTGVGIGGYIIELPNYAVLIGSEFLRVFTDSAENYFMQAGSELGLIGLLLILWVFFELARNVRAAWKTISPNDEGRPLFLGLTAGLISFMWNFLFHSYIGSFEIIYVFWLFAACLLTFLPAQADKKASAGLDLPFKRLAVVLAILFGSIHLWNSTHSLSINSQTEKFGWSQDFGLYDLEKDNRGLLFQWAKQTAGLAIENLGPTLVIPMVASHPDIQRNPVRVKVYSANPYFRKKALIREVTFREGAWANFEWPIMNSEQKRTYLVFETDRSWQPAKLLGVPDSRHLAIGLGEIWYKYPAELPSKNFNLAEKSVYNRWEGEFKENLIGYGISLVNFLVSREGSVLRLWAKGQNAFGIGPYLVIRLDDKVIARTMLTQEQWEPLVLSPQIKPGEHILSVEFKNDLYKAESGQDRNVSLGDLEVIPGTASGEDSKEKRE